MVIGAGAGRCGGPRRSTPTSSTWASRRGRDCGRPSRGSIPASRAWPRGPATYRAPRRGGRRWWPGGQDGPRPPMPGRWPSPSATSRDSDRATPCSPAPSSWSSALAAQVPVVLVTNGPPDIQRLKIEQAGIGLAPLGGRDLGRDRDRQARPRHLPPCARAARRGTRTRRDGGRQLGTRRHRGLVGRHARRVDQPRPSGPGLRSAPVGGPRSPRRGAACERRSSCLHHHARVHGAGGHRGSASASPRWAGPPTSRSVATPISGSDRARSTMEQRCHDMLDAAYAAGIRYVDAARSYGRAEEFLASWLHAPRELAPGALTVGSKWGYRYIGAWEMAAAVHETKDHSLAMFREQLAQTTALLGRASRSVPDALGHTRERRARRSRRAARPGRAARQWRSPSG